MTVILCPLCSLPCFNNLESLRFSLIKAATQNISCPICNEILVGLDKLTIHLFGHTINQNSDELIELTAKNSQNSLFKDSDTIPDIVSEKEKSCKESKDKNGAIGNCSEFKRRCEEDMKSSVSCTINMEDLSYLTSLDTSLSMNELNAEPKLLNSSMVENITQVENTKEDNIELSEYMSDLLTKKLPMFNFAFAEDATEKKKVEKSENGLQNEQFKCGLCEFSFQNSIVFSMHQELVHSTKYYKDSIEYKVENSSSLDTSKPTNVSDELPFKDLCLPRYECHLCQKSFKMKGSLLVHYRVAHLGSNNSVLATTSGNQDEREEMNFLCSICNKSFKKDQHLTQHIKTHEGKQWQCKTCNKSFTTKYFLKKHQRLHTGEMPYSCQTCNKTFTFQQSYHKHLLYHSDEKPHQCTQCGRSFKELSTLHNHQRIHSGEKPFACEACGKCFRQRVSYMVHQRIHTGVLPYQCTACKKKFRYKVSQRSHKCTCEPPGTVVRRQNQASQIKM